MNRFEHVKVGDFIIRPIAEWPYANRGHMVAKVTRVTGSHVVAEVLPSEGIAGGYVVRVNKVTGKQVGGHVYWRPMAR